LKRQTLNAGRFALTTLAAATLWLVTPEAQALGLGRLTVQSALGEALRAEIDITSLTPEEAANLRVRIAPPEAYRAAGVEFSPLLPDTKVDFLRRADGRPYLKLSSDRSAQEPFVDVILELTWPTGRVVREYTVLLDPPAASVRAASPAPATAPVISAAPAAEATPDAPATAARPGRVVVAPAAKPAPVPAAAPSPKPAAAPAPVRAAAVPAPAPAPKAAAPADATASAAEGYRVRRGDTLSRIASRTQPAGVSLDQMLASLYRSNPDAFLGNNMNRLRSGVVLSVPGADTARALAPSEARQIIQAQSADFNAYRQRLAGAVPTTRNEGAARQAAGKVDAEVADRKQSAAATPDKLTLSKGQTSAKAVEAQISEDRAKKDAATRVAELARNVDELKKLSGAASAAPAVAAAAKPAPSAPAVLAVPVAVQKAVSAVVAAASVPVSVSVPAAAPPVQIASAPVVAASVPVVIASAPAVVASVPVAASAPASTAEPMAPAASKPVVPLAPAAEPEVESPGLLSGLLKDNPLALALGGGLMALLAGFGAYKLRKRSRSDSSETSFLESRLQPDSFFGVSGGQHVDTRDAAGAASSMGYSLSQLDAIGDVDPVAEADVYLAYGRDLQAEEILKEAMRASPERMAIRTKLLEVYAKRRDGKGFELLAAQLHGLTGGEGEDWARAQQLGLQLDPENPMYQPGGAPSGPGHVEAAGRYPSLEVSTMPQSVLPTASQFGNPADVFGDMAAASVPAPASDFGVDLDLDLGLDDAPPSMPGPLTSTMVLTGNPHADTPASSVEVDLSELSAAPAAAPRLPAASVLDSAWDERSPGMGAPSVQDMDFSLPDLDMDLDAAPPAAASPASPLSFDLNSISLDLDEPTSPGAKLAAGASDLGAPELSLDDDEASDPLSRKMELAEEFRQIGDSDGARELLQEVLLKADGALKAKAQGMLDDLA
jgi:pilus assembly protein FimV